MPTPSRTRYWLTLELVIEDAKHAHPREWDWSALLDLGLLERAEVLASGSEPIILEKD